MSRELIDRLAAANPVPETPAMESPERLRTLIADEPIATGPASGALDGYRSPHPRGLRRPLLALAALLLLGGSAAAAVLSGERSRPLAGALTHGPAGLGLSHYRISVFPYMAVGWSGWCSSVVFDAGRRRELTAYGCAAVESSAPVLTGPAMFGGPGAAEYAYGVVQDRVASLQLPDGRTVIPVSSGRLPQGTRGYFVLAPPRRRPPRGFLRVFDAGGHELRQPQVTRENAVEHLPQFVVDPRSPGTSPCAVRATPIPGLAALAETVSRPVAWPRRQGGAFLACANATFTLGGAKLAVAVLVDAAFASRPAPALSGLLPDTAHPGILTGHELGNIGFPRTSVFDFAGGQAFENLARHQDLANHDVSARRAGPAWIVAEGGSAAQRALLLAHVSTRV
jgi:hypothetical protein